MPPTATLDELRAALARAEADAGRLAADVRARDVFLASLSHELRSPLNAIIGFAELLRSGAVDPGSPKGRGYLGHIATRGHELLQRINDVVTLAKADTGQLCFTPEPVALRPLVAGLLDLLRTPLLLKGLQADVDVADGVAEVVLDPRRLQQVLFPCLSAAVAASTAREGARLTVRARVVPGGGLRVVVVSPGSQEAAGRCAVSDAPLGAAAPGEVPWPDAGVGLALARRLVQSQGGQLACAQPGDGIFQCEVVLPGVPTGPAGAFTAAAPPVSQRATQGASDR